LNNNIDHQISQNEFQDDILDGAFNTKTERGNRCSISLSN